MERNFHLAVAAWRSGVHAGYPVYTCGKFRYHWLLEWPHKGLRSDLAVFRFFLRKGLALHRENPYDCIIAYSHLTPALLGGILKLLTGAKLILEIATSPNLSFLNNRPRPTMKDRVGRLYSDFGLYLTVKASAQVHLLYRTQLDAYKRLRRIPSTIFHELAEGAYAVAHEKDSERIYTAQFTRMVRAAVEGPHE